MDVPELLKQARRRSPWRQRLVDAERGLALGIRGDGTLFIYLFIDCAVVAVGCVLGLSTLQWLLVGFAVTLVLSLELMQQALRLLVAELQTVAPQAKWDRALNMATASVVLAFTGASIIVACVYWQRIQEMFGQSPPA